MQHVRPLADVGPKGGGVELGVELHAPDPGAEPDGRVGIQIALTDPASPGRQLHDGIHVSHVGVEGRIRQQLVVRDPPDGDGADLPAARVGRHAPTQGLGQHLMAETQTEHG